MEETKKIPGALQPRWTPAVADFRDAGAEKFIQNLSPIHLEEPEYKAISTYVLHRDINQLNIVNFQSPKFAEVDLEHFHNLARFHFSRAPQSKGVESTHSLRERLELLQTARRNAAQNRRKSNEQKSGSSMADVSREELDAKLQTMEARMDTRVAEVVGRMDVMLAEMRADRERAGTLEKSISEFRAESKTAEKEMKAQTSSLKTTIIITAIATVIGLWGANIALSSLMQDSFGAGKEQGATLATTAAEIKATQEKLKEHQERLEKMLQQPTAQPASK